MDQPHAPLLDAMTGQVVGVDMASTYVCIGTLAADDRDSLEAADADLHDCRDGKKNRETYVFDSVRFGIRRNRATVLVRRDEMVDITRFADISES